MATPNASTRKPAAGRTRPPASPSASSKAKPAAPGTPAAARKAESTKAAPTVPAHKAAGNATPPKKAGSSRAQVTKRAAQEHAPVKPSPTPEQRYKMIQEAAYFLAEKNGFNGHAADYWAAAELEIREQVSRTRH